ncbi:MAG: hypothetical protein HYZ21_03380 [Chloroflexi bacterium]|nr:hypothetical protein [Chloroflexota bacterium]
MNPPRSSARPRARRSIVHLLFTFTLTTTMVATAGFGALPENPITTAFQEVIGENVPPELLEPFNQYLDEVSAPQIPPRPVSDSDEESQPDPAGALASLFEQTTAVPTPTQTLSSIQGTLAAIASTQTQVAFIQNAPADWAHTQTQEPLQAPSQTSTSTETHTPGPTETLNLTQTQTQTPTPSITLTASPTTTVTMTPTDVPTAVVIVLPSDTPTSSPVPTNTPGLSSGSCVKNSPNTSTYGCLVSSILLNGVNQTTLTVSTGQAFTFSYSYQVWSDPGNPTGAMQIIAGLETVSASTCDYQNSPGVHPGQTGGSYTHTFNAPSTPGNYAIFIRWIQQSGCSLSNYAGYGTVIALITVQ